MTSARWRAPPSSQLSNTAPPSAATLGAISDTRAPTVTSALIRATPLTVIAAGVLAATVNVRSCGSAVKLVVALTPTLSVAVTSMRRLVSSPWSSNGRANVGPTVIGPGCSWQYPPLQCTSTTLQLTEELGPSSTSST